SPLAAMSDVGKLTQGIAQPAISETMRNALATLKIPPTRLVDPFRNTVTFDESDTGNSSLLVTPDTSTQESWELDITPSGLIAGIRRTKALRIVENIVLLELLLVLNDAIPNLFGQYGTPISIWLASIALREWKSD
ncbi:hypothetical protein, partial [Actinopolyspora mzabensis]|uniref:hypothetical protein n=1 Tax=Actinopolyspora mzabensis TaxID=995066 RepID=UPI001C40B595